MESDGGPARNGILESRPLPPLSVKKSKNYLRYRVRVSNLKAIINHRVMEKNIYIYILSGRIGLFRNEMYICFE